MFCFSLLVFLVNIYGFKIFCVKHTHIILSFHLSFATQTVIYTISSFLQLLTVLKYYLILHVYSIKNALKEVTSTDQ